MKKISFLIQPLGVCLFLIWIYYNQESILTNLLENRLLSYIGKISYGLYLYQGIFLRTGPSGILAIQQFPLNIILTFIVAIFSYEFIEKPILRYKKRFR
jgi:peptidoglycan/LPS O-acetylase OafA/YrhL